MKATKQLHQSIIKACKKNDARAQMKLYDLYCHGMYTVTKRYIKDPCDAQDVMQDAFIKAFKKITFYKEEVAFGAWLKKIVINQSIDWLRKKRLDMVSMEEELVKEIEGTMEETEDWEVTPSITYEEIVSSIDKLKEKYRVVLTLYLLEGYDHKEIAQILGITEVASRTHLRRGKQQVKQYLNPTIL